MTRHTKVMLVLTFLLSIVGFFALPSQSAKADGYSNGYGSAEGYTYRDGYWWLNGQAYTRARVQESYYYWHRNCRYLAYRWVWAYTPVSGVTTTKVINPSEDGWRDKLLDIAKQRDQYEGRMRTSAVEHNEFVESVKLLGMEGNFRWNGYGYEMAYAQNPGAAIAAAQQAYSQFPTPQGNSVYGYRELADVYGNVDLGALYNQAMRLREQSYGNESKATSEVHGLVDGLGSNIAKIKEIEAKGQAAAAALSASAAKDRATVLREFWSTYDSRTKGAPSPATPSQGQPQAAQAGSLQGIIQQKCAACHNSEKKNGGLDLSNLAQITEAQTNKILERIIHPDPTKRMPIREDLSPGEPLSKNEVAAFFVAAYAAAEKGK
jgi:mono/diheme cytochrome c family protein